MKNKVFVLGQYHIDKGKFEESLTHVMCSVLGEEDGTLVSESGLSFGAPPGFNGDKTMMQRPFTHALYIPITQDSADRFKSLCQNLDQLYRRGRLPYHFSKFGFVSLAVEGRIKERLNLYGETEDVGFMDYMGVPYMVDAEGNEIKAKDISWPMNLPKVGTNCMQITIFAARIAGIDLGRLGKDFLSLKRGPKMGQLITSAFEGAVSGRSARHEIFRVQRQNFDGIPLLQTHLYPILDDHLEERGLTPKDIALSEHLEFMGDVYGSNGKLIEYFDGLEPFEGEPLAVPSYLQAELDQMASAEPPSFE